jgi:hypothetical protein
MNATAAGRQWESLASFVHQSSVNQAHHLLLLSRAFSWYHSKADMKKRTLAILGVNDFLSSTLLAPVRSLKCQQSDILRFRGVLTVRWHLIASDLDGAKRRQRTRA